MPIADASGRGHYAGCVLSMQGRDRGYLSFLEAPEHVHVDVGNGAPTIVGTGLEDYFLGGWYFRDGPFVGPFHGLISKDALNASVAMYRVHEADAIRFNERLSLRVREPVVAGSPQAVRLLVGRVSLPGRPERPGSRAAGSG